jgi:hypothetical protein
MMDIMDTDFGLTPTRERFLGLRPQHVHDVGTLVCQLARRGDEWPSPKHRDTAARQAPAVKRRGTATRAHA